MLPTNYESWHQMPNSNENQALDNIKDRERVGTSNRQKQKFMHTVGSKSVACVAEAEEFSSGQKVGRFQLFDITHRKKDGSPMTSKVGEIMKKRRDKKVKYKAIASSDKSVNLEDNDNIIIIEFWVLKDMEKNPNLEEMLSKFISVSETRFQNTETALKNQQALIQGLKTQIGQLSKLISERPQGSLPELSQTKTTETVRYYHEENKDVYEDRRLRIEELDEWREHKSRTHDKPKLCKNKPDTSINQLQVGDIVLLDAVDPHIVTTTPNEEIPLTVLSIFPFGTVEVSHPNFGTFKVNNTRLKPYFKIDNRNEEYELLKPP
ncbi:hypothetical protein GOBAR_AA07160 [Gossypium barbadense]|uniref:Uncharacterized protein n=1 Tax=Gossypium barbadense TaxID=3634 RepID=A0A2P5YCV0_GOSBA|nr:hypothetical protein GOBAR_AA07160 [Gossypium barbadense]